MGVTSKKWNHLIESCVAISLCVVGKYNVFPLEATVISRSVYGIYWPVDAIILNVSGGGGGGGGGVKIHYLLIWHIVCYAGKNLSKCSISITPANPQPLKQTAWYSIMQKILSITYHLINVEKQFLGWQSSVINLSSFSVLWVQQLEWNSYP